MVDGSADIGSCLGAPAGVYEPIIATECPDCRPKPVGNLIRHLPCCKQAAIWVMMI